MKVWEYLRDIKSTQATKQEIFDWFYLNRIDPCCCLTCDKDDPIGIAEDKLKLGKNFKLNKDFIKLITKKYACLHLETLNDFLEEEIKE